MEYWIKIQELGVRALHPPRESKDSGLQMSALPVLVCTSIKWKSCTRISLSTLCMYLIIWSCKLLGWELFSVTVLRTNSTVYISVQRISRKINFLEEIILEDKERVRKQKGREERLWGGYCKKSLIMLNNENMAMQEYGIW